MVFILFAFPATLPNSKLPPFRVSSNMGEGYKKPILRLLRSAKWPGRANVDSPPSTPQPAESGSDLSSVRICRLAKQILAANRHLEHFEIELGDRAICDRIAEALLAEGCVVLREPFKSRLAVTCPKPGRQAA